jgi:DNA (cytosine-5)-methyltransferase 3A
MKLKYLSLFSGCGMFEAAIKEVFPNSECTGFSEIDKYAISVYQNHYPNHKQLGDIIKINIDDLFDFDLMVCGFPCTNLSIAGNRKGLDGDQSKLFYNAIEILKVKKPKYFIFENVESMSNSNRNIITKTIKEIYPNTFLCMINGALVSAQARKRYFWTNFYVEQPTDKKIFLKDIMQPENEINKKYYLNEKSIASIKRIIDKEKDYARILDNFDTKIKTITSRYNASSNADFLNIKKNGYIKSDSQGNRIYNAEYKAVNQSANGGGLGAKTGLYEIEKQIIRKLTPIEVERLFTLHDNYTEHGKGNVKISDSQRYKMLGNGVIKDVVVHILERLKNYMINKEFILDGLGLII